MDRTWSSGKEKCVPRRVRMTERSDTTILVRIIEVLLYLVHRVYYGLRIFLVRVSRVRPCTIHTRFDDILRCVGVVRS